MDSPWCPQASEIISDVASALAYLGAHFNHDPNYYVAFISETGSGEEFAPDKTIPLKPGSFMKHPAGVYHFDGAKDEEVIVQLVGMGPSQTTRRRPELGLFGRSTK